MLICECLAKYNQIATFLTGFRKKGWSEVASYSRHITRVRDLFIGRNSSIVIATMGKTKKQWLNLTADQLKVDLRSILLVCDVLWNVRSQSRMFLT